MKDASFQRTRCFMNSLLAVLAIVLPAQGQVSPDQAKKIEKAIPREARVVPKKPRKVLIWNTPYMEKSPHRGYTIPHSELAFRLMGEKTGAYTPVVSDDQTLLLPEMIKPFDAIVLNNSCGPWTRPTEESLDRFHALGITGDADTIEKQLQSSFLRWIENGGGVVAFHYAIGANRDWPEYAELLGARMWGHPWNEEVGVKVEEPGHPLLEVFQGKDFRITDEIFQYREPYDRSKLRVLLSLDTETTDMTVPWIHRKDGDFALCWVRPKGKGRIFYGEFGHRTELWWNPTLLRFYLIAVQFATGDLEAPIEPRQ
jgi:type 1 glutamine amidotransferase